MSEFLLYPAIDHLGLDRPTGGSVTVNGRPFSELAAPMREVGALLDANAVHGGRSAPTTTCSAWPRRASCRNAGSTTC